MNKKFKVMLVYDSGQRYVFPFDVVAETLNLKPADVRKLEDAVRLELSK